MNAVRNICWIRRDLRLDDHHALYQALKEGTTLIVFNFDPHILQRLKDQKDQRVSFIYDSLKELEIQIQKKGSSLLISYGDPLEEIPRMVKKFNAQNVYTNRDYEPYAKMRDHLIREELKRLGVSFHTFKDTVILEKDEVLTRGGGYFKVFTPYKKRWLEVFEEKNLEHIKYSPQQGNLLQWQNPQNIIDFNWYDIIGFQETPPSLKAGVKAAQKRIKIFKGKITDYHHDRNYPSLEGTSLLSVYLRHGNISVREMVRLSREKRDQGHQSWLNEIIWRDFFQMILDAHPRVVKESFRQEYDQLKYPGTQTQFEQWCQGQTGFPLIDAAMRCLNETGLMHNRLRMITASFLCKILLIDWRLGEEYFAQKLLDYDLAANNGGWQWSSSTGCDAQPYFRIFNPYSQSKQFDSEGQFIKKWVPELRHLGKDEIHHPNRFTAFDYPAPMVSYEAQRLKSLQMYSSLKSK